MNEKILMEIRQYIICNFTLDETEISNEVALLDVGAIDSMGVVDIIAHIEEQYQIVVEDDEISKENFESIQCIANFVGRKLDKKVAV